MNLICMLYDPSLPGSCQLCAGGTAKSGTNKEWSGVQGRMSYKYTPEN